MQLLNATYTIPIAITKSDSTAVTCRGIYVGGAGNLAVSISATATPVVILGVTAGTFLPLALNNGRIMSTDTTATNITAFQ